MKDSVKNLLRSLLRIPIISSFWASIRFGSFVSVKRDKDNDYIYQWKDDAAITSSHSYHPYSNYSDIALFTYDYKPSNKDTVLIVGVADGPEIPYFCKEVKTVIAIEPTPNCVRRLHKLKNLLNLENLIIIDCAAGEYSGKLRLITGAGDDIINRSYSEELEDIGDEVEVNVEPIEKILRSLEIDRVDYCKMNIEGAESEALKGICLETLRIDRFCISAHDFMGPSTRTYDFVYDWLKDNNYFVKTFSPESMTMFFKNYYLYGTYIEKES